MTIQHLCGLRHRSMIDLDRNLRAIGQRLIIVESQALPTLNELINQLGASDVYRSDNVGWYENRDWIELKDTHLTIAVSKIKSSKPIALLSYLPAPPIIDYQDIKWLEDDFESNLFRGGETSGLAHLSRYFASEKPMFYKEVRNAIDGWDNSTKFSPWLANGCLSVREVMSALSNYEKNITANESTYWIYFELLWRECIFNGMHTKMAQSYFHLAA